MNSPKLPVVKSSNNVTQRSDYTGQFTDQVDNTEEIRAIEKDPTLFPNSSRIYVAGEIHEGLKVPMREIRVSDTEHSNGEIEKNEPVRVYDCSGPWGDPEFEGDLTQGLPALKRSWILARADVEEYTGRQVSPEDNGYLSEA
ncbi:MAG: phosphomethylpyrimidine synthase, partial [Planctomycetaceae bacterium]|nr:phosphomethylpyrimidine synthase [Planctomycetaceae bacterium]